MTMRRLMERRRAAIASADAGFTLVELIVAMMIIATVLLLLMAVQTSALVTTTQAKQRQEGSAVANELMEELRALPWASLQRGLHPNYAGATAGVDPNVVGGHLVPLHDPSIDEALVVTAGVGGQGVGIPPLSDLNGYNLTQRTDPAVPGVVFKARTYVSTSTTLAPGVLTLTVIVTWKPASSTVEKFAMARSAAYSPASGGCGNASTQPFLGACQAMLDADAGADGVAVSFTGLDPINPASPVELLTSSSVDRAMLTTAETSATMQSNQAASMSASVTSAGSSQDSMLGVDDSSGRVLASNAASTDVGAAGAAPANPPDVSATWMAASRTVTGSPATLNITLDPPSSLTGFARSKASGQCITGIPLGQPCSLGTTSAEGSSNARLNVPGGSVSVAATSGASTRSAWTARFATLQSTVSALGCTSISGAGCVSSGASRSLGTVTLGTPASGTWLLPAGATGPGYLVRLAGYTDSVRVEHGVGKSTTTPATSRSGTLTYWNGSSLVTLGIGTTVSTTVLIPPVKLNVTGGQIDVAGSITVASAATVRTGTDLACKTSGCGVTTVLPSITVAITYTITVGGVSHAVVVGVDLGSLRATGKYKAAPDA